MEKNSYDSVPTDDSSSYQDDALLHRSYTRTPKWVDRLREKRVPTIWYMLPLYIINTIILVLVIRSLSRDSSSSQDPLLDLYSPANEAVRYRDVTFAGAFGRDLSPYQGWPDDHKDEIWEDMYKFGMSIHIPESEATKLQRGTENFAGAPGYENEFQIGLDVFHQLHCLNMIRKAFYPDRYPGAAIYDKDGKVFYPNWIHTDHCIESLRQSLTCSADISVMTYTWSDKNKFMKPNLNISHKCRDFDTIRTWAFSKHPPGNYSNRAHVGANGQIRDWSEWGDALADVDVDKLGLGKIPEELRQGVPSEKRPQGGS
ncbi:hypothetical protein CC80DRAFT_448045 [Byssothecium circinans]|uniref:Tat pathway signal sequence n=1 Tax=Byssothecium circinans TaxID=147558 RepID=A0A6A5TWA1_9PLEO|nr:hypothetical protein CC80DRAFT_448045 [Byssothecium circinans]